MKLNAIILTNTTCYELILLKLCMYNLKQQLWYITKYWYFVISKYYFSFSGQITSFRAYLYKKREKNKCSIIMYNKDKENKYGQWWQIIW